MDAPTIDRQQPRELRTGGQSVPYLLWVPGEDDEPRDEPLPLLLFLHGAGERGGDLRDVARHGVPAEIERGRDLPFVALSPQCPPGQWWTQRTDLLAALVDAEIDRLPVDPDRVYLTGMSMGGYGAWNLAIERPHRFAAMAPVCGGGNPARVRRIAHLPVWAFHGTADRVVPFHESKIMVAALEAAGGDVRLTAYEGVGHDSWTQTYANPELYRWFLSHHRPR